MSTNKARLLFFLYFYKKCSQLVLALAPKRRHHEPMIVNSRMDKLNKIRQNIRLEENLWQAIDQMRTQRAGNVSRNTWITEAIHEKLSREQVQNPTQTVRSEPDV